MGLTKYSARATSDSLCQNGSHMFTLLKWLYIYSLGSGHSSQSLSYISGLKRPSLVIFDVSPNSQRNGNLAEVHRNNCSCYRDNCSGRGPSGMAFSSLCQIQLKAHYRSKFDNTIKTLKMFFIRKNKAYDEI